MSRREPLPTSLPAAFSVPVARASGVGASRLRAKDLSAPFRGVRIASSAPTRDQRLRAFAARMSPHEFFSHLTAAQLYEVPMPFALERNGVIHSSVVFPRARPRVAGAVGHQLSRDVPRLILRGLPVVAPAIAWTQLGRLLTDDQLVIAADHLVRRKRPFCTVGELADAAATATRDRKRLERALLRVRAGTDSAKETELRLLVVASGLPEPVIHHTILNVFGDFVATPDLAYVPEKIALEYEGEHHRTDPHTYLSDIERREAMEQEGWLVVRIVKSHLSTRPQWLTTRIRAAMAARAPG